MAHEHDRFRRDLAGVLDRWVSEDLVSADQARRLRAYYQLDQLEAAAGTRFVGAILVFGAILIGLGVISFVAANWAEIPPAVRAITATLLMVGANFAGWRLREGGWGGQHRRWGTVLLIVGAFLLGADIALTAQWFQVAGSGGGLFLGWGLGVLAMAWGLRHAGLGAIAAVVFVGAGQLDDFRPWLPWVYAVGVAPLALLTGSRVLFGLAVLAAFGAVGVVSIEAAGIEGVTLAMLATALGAMGAGALAPRAPAWRAALDQTRAAGEPDAAAGMAVVGERLGAGVLGLALLGWSFQGIWREEVLQLENARSLPIVVAFAAAMLAVAAIAAARRAEARPTMGAVAAAAGVLTGLLMLGHAFPRAGWLALPENVALAGFALWAAWRGLMRAERAPFWMGLALLTMQVGMRFFEFETGLMLKSAAFVAWGVGLIFVGLWFERALSARKTGAEAVA